MSTSEGSINLKNASEFTGMESKESEKQLWDLPLMLSGCDNANSSDENREMSGILDLQSAVRDLDHNVRMLCQECGLET